VYAVGAVTYALMTGGPPFLASSISDVLARDPDSAPPSLQPLLHDSVGEIDEILARTLAYRVGDRWSRADSLAERLEQEAYRLEQEAPALASQRTTVGDQDGVRTTVAQPAHPPRRRRSHRGWLATLPLLFLLAAAGGWYLVTR
jgi:hypothetical protein